MEKVVDWFRRLNLNAYIVLFAVSLLLGACAVIKTGGLKFSPYCKPRIEGRHDIDNKGADERGSVTIIGECGWMITPVEKTDDIRETKESSK